MQRCYQTRCCPAAEGRRTAPAQEPVPAGRLGGGVPGALPRQDPTAVPRDHQAQPGPVLDCFLSYWRSFTMCVCCYQFTNTSLAQGASQPITTSYCVWEWQVVLKWVIVQAKGDDFLQARCTTTMMPHEQWVQNWWMGSLVSEGVHWLNSLSLKWKGNMYCYTCKPIAGYQCAIQVCIDFLKPEW